MRLGRGYNILYYTEDHSLVDAMGRIKTSQVKNISRELFAKYPDKFTTDFRKNKQFLKENFELSSQKLTNVISGYITKLKKQSERM